MINRLPATPFEHVTVGDAHLGGHAHHGDAVVRWTMRRTDVEQTEQRLHLTAVVRAALTIRAASVAAQELQGTTTPPADQENPVRTELSARHSKAPSLRAPAALPPAHRQATTSRPRRGPPSCSVAGFASSEASSPFERVMVTSYPWRRPGNALFEPARTQQVNRSADRVGRSGPARPWPRPAPTCRRRRRAPATAGKRPPD